MSVNKRAMGADPSKMPKEFWAAYRKMLDRGLCDEALAEGIVAFLHERDLCDDDYYDHVRTGEQASGPSFQAIIEHLVTLHMGKMHNGKCLADSATPLLYTAEQPHPGLGTHLLYVNPGGTEGQFFAFALNHGCRGRIFVPEGWCVASNPGYVAFKCEQFLQPTILKKLERHICQREPFHPRPAPAAVSKQVLDAVVVMTDSEYEASRPTTPSGGGAVGKRPAGTLLQEAEAPTKKRKAAEKPPKPAKPGFFTSWAPTKCCLTHECGGGDNQCVLTNGHDGPHIYWHKNRATGLEELQPKWRIDNHVFEPWERELADVTDLKTFGAEALPTAAARQAARDEARQVASEVASEATSEVASEVAGVGGAPAHASDDLNAPTSPGLEMLSEAAAVGSHPRPASPSSWSVDLQIDEASKATGSTSLAVPAPAKPTMVELAHALEQKKLELADLKLKQAQAEAELSQLKQAIVASMELVEA